MRSKMKILTGFALLLLTCSAYAEDAVRTELKRSDITGTNMEMVISITEAKPGDTIPRHSHHGEEGIYVLQGATVETPDGKQILFKEGATSVNVRDVAHGGIKIVGDKALKLLTVHAVDKGKPLYEPAK
jgi:quercetin dioxygenase-like cupin family protein